MGHGCSLCHQRRMAQNMFCGQNCPYQNAWWFVPQLFIVMIVSLLKIKHFLSSNVAKLHVHLKYTENIGRGITEICTHLHFAYLKMSSSMRKKRMLILLWVLCSNGTKWKFEGEFVSALLYACFVFDSTERILTMFSMIYSKISGRV